MDEIRERESCVPEREREREREREKGGGEVRVRWRGEKKLLKN